MNLLWVSPSGAGLEVALRALAAGHNVVGIGDVGPLPEVRGSATFQFAKAADLVVVDGTFPLERTKRSWKPQGLSTFFEELRRKHLVTALGPTPTIDLLVGDRRYLRKWCERLGIPYLRDDGETSWRCGAWFRKEDVVPPGPYLESWKPLFKSVGFRGWFEMQGKITSDGPTVTCVSATWDADSLPAGREIEFLQEMCK